MDPSTVGDVMKSGKLGKGKLFFFRKIHDWKNLV